MTTDDMPVPDVDAPADPALAEVARGAPAARGDGSGRAHVDEALARRVRGDGPDAVRTRTVEQLAADADVHEAVVEAIAREGLLTPLDPDAEEPRFRPEDAEAVRAGVELLEAGVPLGELLDLARHSTEALRGVAERAVGLFLAYVRDPALADELAGAEDAASAAVEAFDRMLPAARGLVATHFGQLLVEEARERLDTGLADTALADTGLADTAPATGTDETSAGRETA